MIAIEMEMVKGGSLKSLMDSRIRFSEEEASTIIRCILKAIEHVHEKNFVHRDLKPENILFDNPKDLSSIKLADFGLSAAMKVKADFLMNEKMGTLLFMAPEQSNNKSYGKVNNSSNLIEN